MNSSPPKKFSILKTYGIFVFVSTICLGVIVYTHIYNNNVLFWFALVLFIIFGIIRILLMLHSLSNESQKQSEHAIQLSQEKTKLLTLINSLGEAVFAVNKEGYITVYNSAALELIDSHQQLENKLLSDVFKLVDKDDKPISIIKSVVEQSKVSICDNLFIVSDIGKVPLYIIATPLKQDGDLVGAIILARDISRQKNLQTQKDEFLSVISHELRTPVAIVEADLSTVLLPNYTKLDSKATKLLRSASQNISYLSGLLQDISDLSHAQRSILDVELHSVDIKKLTAELAEDFLLRAKKAELSLELEYNASNNQIVTSQQRVQEILVNFLTNAIKYSSGVGKSIKIIVSDNTLGGISVSVCDQGLGLSDTEQTKLFSKFYRSSREEVQAIKGTGMGLYISAQQAKKIGGDITINSQINRGSTFTLELPPKVPDKLVATTQ